MSLVITATSKGITASSVSGGVETCGKGQATILRIERKGTGADAADFKLTNSQVDVKVVNPYPIEFPENNRVMLGRDETGVYVVVNNVCD